MVVFCRDSFVQCTLRVFPVGVKHMSIEMTKSVTGQVILLLARFGTLMFIFVQEILFSGFDKIYFLKVGYFCEVIFTAKTNCFLYLQFPWLLTL